MIKPFSSHPTALALAAAALALPAAAWAQASPEQVPSVEVRYDDLNLTTESGQRTLERRLDRAARQVCAVNVRQTGTHLPVRGSSSCYQQARARLAREVATLVSDSQRGG